MAGARVRGEWRVEIDVRQRAHRLRRPSPRTRLLRHVLRVRVSHSAGRRQPAIRSDGAPSAQEQLRRRRRRSAAHRQTDGVVEGQATCHAPRRHRRRHLRCLLDADAGACLKALVTITAHIRHVTIRELCGWPALPAPLSRYDNVSKSHQVVLACQ